MTAGKRKFDKKGDSIWIPEGQEPLFLSGVHSFTISTNGWFRFVTDTSPEAVKKRRRETILTWVIAILCISAAYFLGKVTAEKLFSSRNETPQEYTSHGLTMTLTKGFKEEEYVTYTTGFTSKDVAILALQEPFSLAPGFEELTLEEYTDLVRQANGKTDCEIRNYNGIPGFEFDFTNEDVKKDFHYRIYAYKAEDAFWTIQFVTLQDSFKDYEEKINTWAASAEFGEAK